MGQGEQVEGRVLKSLGEKKNLGLFFLCEFFLERGGEMKSLSKW
jgi:hypothetical protein